MSLQSTLSHCTIFTTLILALLLNACATDEELVETQNDNQSISTFALDQNYLLETSEGIETVANHTISLSFEQDSTGMFLSLNSGCNGVGGSAEIIVDVLHVNELNSTLKACEPELMEQDAVLGEFILSRPQMTWDASSITLSNESITLRFVLERVLHPSLNLVGPLWTVNGFIEGEVASSSISSSQQTIIFEANGEAQVNTGCNSCFATYELEGNEIKVTSLGCTEAACLDEDGQTTEGLFTSILFATTSYEIDGNSLTLTDTESQRAITLSGSER